LRGRLPVEVNEGVQVDAWRLIAVQRRWRARARSTLQTCAANGRTTSRCRPTRCAALWTTSASLRRALRWRAIARDTAMRARCGVVMSLERICAVRLATLSSPGLRWPQRLS